MDSTLQTTVSSITEQKYVNLRKRLDQLGYRQTLGIESLPLIEKLFNDLVFSRFLFFGGMPFKYETTVYIKKNLLLIFESRYKNLN